MRRKRILGRRGTKIFLKSLFENRGKEVKRRDYLVKTGKSRYMRIVVFTMTREYALKTGFIIEGE